ncbi:MAG TPA: alpha/beta fold hydrolase, partial [Saprospiraceae bacterium]|nr:alpha/beta fold hydrolase [Saprospiraceae bacterium]
MRRIARFFGYFGLFLLAAAFVAVEYVLPYWPIKPFRMDPAHATWRLPMGSDPATYGLHAEPLTICTHDTLCLQALYIPAVSAQTPQDSGLCVLMIPGIGSCKEFFLPTAQYFAQHGISSLLLDQRAHGQSGGEFCTFGFHEKHDVSTAVDTLLSRHPRMRVGVMGHSLGGAVALQSLAHDPRLQFGIVESTFHSLEAVVEQYGQNYFGIRSNWLARHTLDKSAAIAQFDPYSVLPCKSAECIRQPVFMSHGDADERIPIAFGRINYEHLASASKEWHTIPGARHNNV